MLNACHLTSERRLIHKCYYNSYSTSEVLEQWQLTHVNCQELARIIGFTLAALSKAFKETYHFLTVWENEGKVSLNHRSFYLNNSSPIINLVEKNHATQRAIWLFTPVATVNKWSTINQTWTLEDFTSLWLKAKFAKQIPDPTIMWCRLWSFQSMV